MTNNTLSLYFGGVADSLADQLLQQNLVYKDHKLLDQFQKDSDAITRLNIRGYLSDSVTKTCRAKLLKKLNPPKKV